MKVSLSWLKELVKYNLSPKELADKLSLVTIGVKDQTEDYLELDLTYNRGDLLSLRGVAREVGAITNSTVSFSTDKTSSPNLPQVQVQVEDEKLCPVYCVAKIEGLKVAPSTDTWVKKLADSGIRSVNNVADVTNLIMVEYGQPLHAFDADKVAEETLIVRCAKAKEELITLDNKKRKLSEEDLVIGDSQKALGLAGVMGGKDSEVTESTITILLEAAIFDPVSNRRTSKRHGLYSEATKRIQHGLTKTNLLQALSAAIKMYEGLGGKLTAINLVGDLKDQEKTIKLSIEKLNNLLGVDIDAKFVKESLEKLGFEVKGELVKPPYFRLDINLEEDVIEEVARIYGYEKIEGVELKDDNPIKLDQSLYNFIYDLKEKLKKEGLTEVQTYSFYSTQVLNALNLISREGLVKIANPISLETKYLRDNLWPNLVEVVGRNLRKGHKDIGIFEIGKVYQAKDGKPQEEYRLSIALSNETTNPLAELYKIAQNLEDTLGVYSTHTRGVQNRELSHPKRQQGNLAEVHLRVLNKLGIEKRVVVLEIELG